MLISILGEISLLAFPFDPRQQIIHWVVCTQLMLNEFYLFLHDFSASEQLDLLQRAIKCLSHLQLCSADR